MSPSRSIQAPIPKSELIQKAIRMGMLQPKSATEPSILLYPEPFEALQPFYKGFSGHQESYWLGAVLQSNQDVGMFCLDLLLYLQWEARNILATSQNLLAPYHP